MSRLTRDGTAEPVSRDQILRREPGQGNFHIPVPLTTSRIGSLTRLIHTLLYVMIITPAKQEKRIFSCPRSRLGIWSREMGSAVSSRVSLLIRHLQAESGAHSPDSSRFPRRRPFIHAVIRHRVSPEFIGSRTCVPMALITESQPAQGQ